MFLEELGCGEASARSLPEWLYATFTRIESYRLYDDAVPTLARLKRLGLTLRVISNWEEWLDQLMVPAFKTIGCWATLLRPGAHTRGPPP